MKTTALKPGTKRLTSTTELARGTPLQRGQPLQAGTTQLKRTQLRPSQSAPNRAGQEQLRDKHPATPRRPALKSRQRAVTATEKLHWDRLASLGCIACRIEGKLNRHLSIHHTDGRTKPGCHQKVLPLCGPHHQDDGTALAIHPWKARFEARYGSQQQLMDLCAALLAAPDVAAADSLLFDYAKALP